MSIKETLQDWIKSTRKTWGLLMQFAVFIFGVVGSFLLSPPGWVSNGGNKTVVRLSQFIVAVLVGLIFLLIQKWKEKKHIGWWAVLAIVFLSLSVSVFFLYQHVLDTRTCQYAGKSVVIGTRYTAHALEYLRENPDSTCRDLLNDFVGNQADIWTQESIDRSRYVLAATYILSLPLFTICIVSVIQALYCSQARAPSPKQDPNRIRRKN